MEIKEKKAPKYYEHKRVYVEITGKMKKEVLIPAPGFAVYIQIGKSINYSSEAVRKVFVDQPDKVIKTLWEGIVAWKEANSGPVAASDKPKSTKKESVKEKVVKKKNGKTGSKSVKKAVEEYIEKSFKPIVSKPSPATQSFLEKRRAGKL